MGYHADNTVLHLCLRCGCEAYARGHKEKEKSANHILLFNVID